jgi:predicted amidohydrolase
MRRMEKPSLWAIALVVGTLALAGLAAAGPVEIPLPEGAFMRLGMGWISGNVIFSPDGRYLAVGTSIGVELRDAGTLELVRFFAGHTSRVYSVAFSPDGRILASGSWDKTIKLWDVATGKELRTLKGHTDYVFSVAFSPDGRILASGSGDETIKLWEVATGKELRTLKGHTNWVLSVAFSPDGKILASGSWDDTIKLWDVATGRELRTLSGHTDDVESVAFSPDGRTLASGSYDKTIKLWDVATGKELRTLSGHTGSVKSVAFSPDGRILASGSGDGTVLLWDLSFLNRPQVLKVMFPATVFTGTEAQGTVRFADPNADLVRAEFTMLEGPLQSFALDLTQPPYAQVQGKTEGSFTFTLKVDQPGTYRLRVTLVDAAGLRSEPHEFSFQAKIPTPPKIVRITFPEVVKLGQEGTGFVRYEDPDGDIARAEFTVVEGDPATITVSPDLSMVQGSTSGSFRFTVVATQAQTVVLRLVLVDSAGLRSDPMEFTFRVE